MDILRDMGQLIQARLTHHDLILQVDILFMEIVFLGNWSARLAPGKVNTSFVIDGKIACDFGPGSLQSMIEKGLDPNGLEQVLISHMHYDHFAGLTGLLWYRAMSGTEEELLITGPDGIEKTSKDLLESYRTPHGFHIYASFEKKSNDDIQIISGDHTIPNNGYRIHYNGRTVFYTGDTAFSELIVKGAENVDLLIHEMTYTDDLRIEAELWRHSTVSDVMSTFTESSAKRLVPVHLTAETLKAIPALQRKNDQLFLPEGSILL